MTKSEFLNEFKENLQIKDELNINTKLKDIDEWDSLAFLTTMAMFNDLFGMQVSGETLKSCQTIEDIIKIANENIK